MRLAVRQNVARPSAVCRPLTVARYVLPVAHQPLPLAFVVGREALRAGRFREDALRTGRRGCALRWRVKKSVKSAF
jgi:hypothetical protein